MDFKRSMNNLFMCSNNFIFGPQKPESIHFQSAMIKSLSGQDTGIQTLCLNQKYS
jgi:hypothetical protein